MSCVLQLLSRQAAWPAVALTAAGEASALIGKTLSTTRYHTSPFTSEKSMTVATAQVDCPPSSTAAADDASTKAAGPPYTTPEALEAHVERAWSHFRSLGSPQWHVAPMVDQSELPFRMLCRAHGAQAAYTPMLHARLFLEHKLYRSEHFTTCEGDRPLFVQFCANDPEVFVAAAALVQDHADYIDLNLGCPQRIAKRGYYGAFLMDNLGLVKQLVTAAATQLKTPVSVKIRLFPELQTTIDYALMLQQAGASLLAVHGRTRDMKDHAAHRADWEAIAAVRKALRIPVLANGDVRCLEEARALMAATGADGVMSAEPLLMNPMLFDPQQQPQNGTDLPPLECLRVCDEYLEWCERHPSHLRMVRGHVHKLITTWLQEYTDIRARMHQLSSDTMEASITELRRLVSELRELVAASGRDYPVPKIPERKLKAMEREAAKAAAIAEQAREAAALAEIEAGKAAAAAVDGAAAVAAVGSNGQHAGASSEKLQYAVAVVDGVQTAAAAVVVPAGAEPGSGDPSSPAAKRQAVDSMACC